MRFIGLDVHRDWCDVAIYEDGKVRSAGRITTEPDQLALFAQSLGPEDRVGLETTGNALSIARIIEPHVAGVLVAARRPRHRVRGVRRGLRSRAPRRRWAARASVGGRPAAGRAVSMSSRPTVCPYQSRDATRWTALACAGPGSPDTWLVNVVIMPWRPDASRGRLAAGCGSRGVQAASAR